MTPDHSDLPNEIGQALGRLGQVAPPDPGVLDAAREVLWAAVAAEMLPEEAAGAAGQAGETGERQTGERQTGERQTGERQTGERQTGERETGQPGQAGRLRPGDPGA